MKTLVMKFGGTSVGSVAAIENVIQIVRQVRQGQAEQVAVVVSAMSGVTNILKSGILGAAAGETEKAQQIGLERLGRPTEMNESLVNRVARMVFAEDLAKKDLKQRTRKITRQSNARQGGGVTKPQDPREDPRAEFDRLYRELERA